MMGKKSDMDHTLLLPRRDFVRVFKFCSQQYIASAIPHGMS